jgi:type II secretory pathway pseudopilin PulG
MIKNKNKKSGFTLIELLIAISIFMGFMIVASNAYVEIIRAKKQ